MSIIDLALEEASKNFEEVVKLRRYFHKHPELPKMEFNTANTIEKYLNDLGLETQRVGETGIYAQIIGEAKDNINKDIILRADIDALPIVEAHECEYKSQNEGVMHACGHDAHAASLLVAAKILVNNKDKFSGKIRLCFQQAEEIGYGARLFVDGGYLDGADRSFGIHVGSNVPSGKIVVMAGPNNASVDWFKITVNGKSAHVSTPELGVDSAYIISQIVVAVQALVSRMTSPMENVLIGIGKIDAGSAYNIVAESATAEGTIRCLNSKIRKETKARLEELVKSIALVYGGSATIEFKDFTSVLENDEKSTIEAQNVAFKLFGQDNVITSRKPALGGDDMAEFIIKVPGVYAYTGTGNENKECTTVAHHNPYFDIDEDGLKTSVAMYVGYALSFLNNEVE